MCFDYHLCSGGSDFGPVCLFVCLFVRAADYTKTIGWITMKPDIYLNVGLCLETKADRRIFRGQSDSVLMLSAPAVSSAFKIKIRGGWNENGFIAVSCSFTFLHFSIMFEQILT